MTSTGIIQTEKQRPMKDTACVEAIFGVANTAFQLII